MNVRDWDYRIVAHSGGGEAPVTVYTIAEVWYGENDVPISWDAVALETTEQSLTDMRTEVIRLMQAFDEPILWVDHLNRFVEEPK